MKQLSRIMDKPADFQKLGIDPHKVADWEDGIRIGDQPGTSEIWYFACSFDDGSTLVLGFRSKSVAQVAKEGYLPNLAMTYTPKGQNTYYDYRTYSAEQSTMSKEKCQLKFGPTTLIGNHWKDYTIHIAAEPDREVVMEGIKSIHHQNTVDLHLEAVTAPFRPGTGYIAAGGNDEHFYNFICVTKLKVTGDIKINGEKKHVTGYAYYNHQWMNISAIQMFHHWIWGRQLEGKYSVMLFDMVMAERFGLTQVPLFTVNDASGKLIFQSDKADNVRFEVLDSYIQKQTGKRYPRKMRYLFDKDNISIEYTITNRQEINILDLYANANEEIRNQFDRLHEHPTYTRYLADTDLVIKHGGKQDHVTGSMLYEINYPGIENSAAHLF